MSNAMTSGKGFFPVNGAPYSPLECLSNVTEPTAVIKSFSHGAHGTLFQDRDYPVLNDYRAVLGGLFRSLWTLTPAQCAQIFPQVTPVDLQLV